LIVDFDNIAFPGAISLNSVAGPEFSTDVTETAGGFEKRNQNWSGARLRFNVATGVRTEADYEVILNFFYGRAGRARAFRFQDWSDFKSCPISANPLHDDQVLGVGDGANQFFQLQKSYVSGPVTYVRKITRPVVGTVKIGLGGINQPGGWIVNHDTGLITFTTPPAPGIAVSAGFEFDVPARFDIDRLEPVHLFRGAVELPELPIVEIRE
jgi:uncharacterized protein (TIGR02217 family)